MPFPKLSTHNKSSMRLQPYQHLLGRNVIVGPKMFLVTGEDEAELLRFDSAPNFATRTEPWIPEVDLWSPFMNIGFNVLEGLEETWMQ